MDTDKAIKELKKEWFIEALLHIKALHNHTQQEIADNLGVSQPMISRIKSGRVGLPDSIITKAVEVYKLEPPSLESYSKSMVREPTGNSYSDNLKIRYSLLERNMADIRRELETTYSYIADLKEFNSFLKLNTAK